LRHLTRRRVVFLGLLSALALVLVGRWLNATKVGGQEPAEPFRIAGNLYYVGANDVAAFLITGPEGHVMLASSRVPARAESGGPAPRLERFRIDARPRPRNPETAGVPVTIRA
jgi:hypothetical protein